MQKLVGTRVDDELLSEFDSAVSRLGYTKSQALREALALFIEHAKGMEVVRLRKIPFKQVKKEVHKFIKGKNKVWPDEISDELRLDIEVVIKALDKLWEEGKAEVVK